MIGTSLKVVCRSPLRSNVVVGTPVFALSAIAILLAGTTLSAEPTAVFSGAQSVVALGSGVAPSGVAADSAGNVYVADNTNKQVVKAAWSGGVFTVTVVANSSANGLGAVLGVAADASGNVYIADATNNRVVKMAPSGSSYTLSVVGNAASNGLNDPTGVTVDASGNVYIADTGNTRVLKETLSGGSYTQSVVTSSLLGPRSVAVDTAGAVYIADGNGTTSNQVLKETLKSGSYTQSTVANHASNGLSDPVAVGVDPGGNVYIADTGLDEVLKETLSGNTYTQSVLANHAANGIVTPAGAAVDWTGSAYIADTGTNDLIKVQSPAASLGMVPDASTSAPDQLTFTFNTADTLNATPYTITAMGATGQEFADAGTGTCAASKSYTAGQSCTVNVTFAPIYSGTRNGAVILQDSNSNVIATALISGVGTGPQIVHFGGYEVIAETHIGQASDVAVDSNGLIYITDEGGGLFAATPAVYRFAPATNVKIPLGTGWVTPIALAVDGAGNVYVSDYSQAGVFEIPANATIGSTPIKVPITVQGPIGLAIDSQGNLFVADAKAAAVYKMTPSGAVTSLGANWVQPNRLAVDSAGNLYVTDFGNGTVHEITPSGVEILINGTDTIVLPYGIAVDPSGMIYVASGELNPPGSQTQIVYEMTQAGVATPILTQTDGAYPQGLTLDTKGNLYVADSNEQIDLPSSLIYEVDRFDPLQAPLNFPTSTNVQTKDTTDGNMTVTFENIGNQPLEFVTGSGTNPSYPPSFPENSADTNLCTSPSLAAGATCDVSLYFDPEAVGAISDEVVLADNSLNQAEVTQTVPATGTGIGKSQTITFTQPTTPVVYGVAPIALTATATSGLPIAFSIVSGPGAISGSTLTVTGVGTIVVAANQAGGGIYNAAAQVTNSVVVNQGSQTINFTAPASPVAYSTAPISLSATATSGLAVTFSIVSGPGSLNGSNLTITGVGTITIAANQAGNADYTAATQVTQTIVVTLATQTINFRQPPTPVAYGVKPIVLSATATSGLGVTFTIMSGPGSISGSALTVIGIGTIVVAANQAGNADYTAAAQVTQSVVVDRGSQTITFTAPKTPVAYGVKPITLSAKSSSGLAVTLSVTSGPGKISGDVLTITGVGSVVVAATQVGNADYNAAAKVSHTIVVDKATQTITFAAPKTPVVYGVKPITLSAKSSADLAVTFSVVSGPAKVKGDGLTIIGAGSVVVAAAQAGNADYAAAAEVKHTIVVDPATVTVTATSLTVSEGAALPKFTYKMTGFVDGDTQESATTGVPKLTTTATAPLKTGSYSIFVTKNTLAAKSYKFTLVNGKLTVNP